MMLNWIYSTQRATRFYFGDSLKESIRAFATINIHIIVLKRRYLSATFSLTEENNVLEQNKHMSPTIEQF